MRHFIDKRGLACGLDGDPTMEVTLAVDAVDCPQCAAALQREATARAISREVEFDEVQAARLASSLAQAAWQAAALKLIEVQDRVWKLESLALERQVSQEPTPSGAAIWYLAQADLLSRLEDENLRLWEAVQKCREDYAVAVLEHLGAHIKLETEIVAGT